MQVCNVVKKYISCLNSILKFKKEEQKSVRKGKTNNKTTKEISGVRGLVLVSA